MFSSTIKPYKFVNPSSISAGGGGATIIAGGKKITGGMTPQIKSARVTMLAINRIGMAMEGLGKTQQQIRDIIVYENKYLTKSSDFKKKREGYRRDQKSEAKSESFGKKQKDDVAKEVVKKEKKQLSWLEKIFGPFVGIISFVGRFVIGQTVLRWMADPKNTDKLTVFVKSFGKVFKWAYNIAYKSTDAVLTGFAKVFGSSDKKGLDRFGEVLGGLGQLLIGIAGFKALGYLLKPWSLVTDILDLVDLLGSGDKSVDLPDGGKPTGGKPDPKLKGSQERYFKKYGRDAFIKRFGEEGLKNLPRNMQRSALRQFGRNAKAFGIRTTQKVLGKGVSKALGKIPIIGPVIDFAIRTLIFKEPLGKAAASAVGAAIGQGIGGAIGTVGAGALAGGTFGVGLAAAPIIIGASSLIGGFLGDYVGSKLYDWIAPFFSKDKTPQMAKGGIVTKPTKAIIGEKGPEVVIPLSKLGGFGVAATIIGATHSALSRMGAAGEIAKSLIGADLNAAESIFGSSKVGGGGSLGKSVMKASKTSSMEIDAGNDISILIGQENITIKDRKDPSNKPTTLRGQLANILGALIWVSKKNISGGGTGSPGPGPAPAATGGGVLPGDAPPIVKAMLDAIAAAEGGWDSVNPGTTVPGLSKMTIAEARRAAMAKGYGMGGSGAMGKWQQMPQFILERSRSAGLDPNKDIFNQENQTKSARMLMAGVYPGGEKQLVADAQQNPLKAAANLRGTWPSLPGGSQENSHSKNFVAHFNQNVSKYAKMSKGGLLTNPRPGNGPLIENKMILKEEMNTSKFAKGGKIFLHWTAGGYQFKQPGHYHSVVQGDGTVARLHDYNDRSVSHTYKRNGTGVGLSIAAMGGNPDPWSMPPKPIQITNMAKEIANIAKSWKWKPSDINLQNVMTHAEAASLKDGSTGHDNYGPKGWGGTGERWDLWQLKKGEPNGSGGNKLRAMARGFMGGDSTVKDESGASTTISPSDSNSTPGGSESIEPPETIESVLSKLESAVQGLNTSLGYTPAATPSAKPAAPSTKPTPAASSSGSQMSKASEQAARLEEAAAAVQGSAQIVPMPINTSVNVPAAFSGQQVYYPRSPITYGI